MLVVVLGLAALVGLVTAEALTSPLERLAAAIRQVARGDSSITVPQSSIREIASLAADFEDMQRQLARREAEERAARTDAETARQAAEDALRLRDVFLRTLAHDLKAPLASLAWHIQVLQRRARRGQLEPGGAGRRFAGYARAVPQSSIREVASLAADFEDMQRQLAGREAEERAARIDAEAARQAAEDALRLRDVFLRTLAHDLKAPLASLAWHIQVLQRRARRGQLEPAELDEGLRVTNLGAADAIAAIDELSDLTRLAGGGRLSLQRGPVDLVALGRDIVSTHPDSARHRIDFASQEPSLVVQGDPARLSRVLRNLLDNALKYSSSDQPVTVSVRQEDFDGERWAMLSVQDHGIGIPSADLPHVFDLYHRGGNAGSIEGEGLGLASVRQLVEQHGGTVEVQSALGLGSLFIIRLPLEPLGTRPM